MGLTSLTLPIGSSDNRLTLTQTQVNTLISVYYDTGITTKNVSGYVYKASLKRREYYLLTQLGLNVAYGTLTDDMWGITSAKPLLNSGESTTFAATGEVTTADPVLELGSCAVEYGQIDAEDLQDCFTLAGGSLSFDKGSIPTDFTAKAVVRAHPVWNASDIKEVEVGAVSVSSMLHLRSLAILRMLSPSETTCRSPSSPAYHFMSCPCSMGSCVMAVNSGFKKCCHALQGVHGTSLDVS